MKKILISVLSLLVVSTNLFYAQTLYQTIKGQVIDKASQISLPGASVVIEGSNPVMGTSTDADGKFRINDVPVGRYNITVSYVGYTSVTIPEVLVNSGKEISLTVELIETNNVLKEVVVKAHTNKNKPLNAMSAISARSFNVEETRRYAGGFDDPARLVTAFAGVATGGNMQDNAIVIRGNAPKGVLWRVEGVDVPNPNHFSGGNVAGGGFASILSSQVLSNSDFLTGAFAAEYGNALAGVFDIKLRTGNSEKREFAVQAGLMGLDFAAEGPIVRGKNSSYLFNYRYSTFGLLSNLGMMSTEQTPIYQDLSFKISLPTKKAGVFSVWGIGGIDNIFDPEEKNSELWETDFDRYKCNWDEKFGATGLNHKYILSKKSYLSTSIVLSGDMKLLKQQRLNDQSILQDDMYLENNNGKLTFSSYINNKFSAKHTNRTGVNFNTLFYSLDLNGTANDVLGSYRNYVKENGNSYHIQLYTQSKYNLTNNFFVNAGIQVEYFGLNKNYTIDPRLAFSWEFSTNQSISFGYGKHSQLEDLSIYLINNTENGTTTYPNKDLSFSHAHHFVFGYDWKINENMRLKVEPYFQYLYGIPGIADSSFSMINYKQDLTFRESLENNSIGQNIGIDITLERFLKNNFYYLITASVFDSKYKADDKKWRNTRYNKGFVANILVGKEFFVGNHKNNILGVNVRMNMTGGERYTSLLSDESQVVKRPIYDEYNAFKEQDKFSNFLDLTVTYRINKKRHSSVWAIQVKNILGTPQYGKYKYNHKTQLIERPEEVYIVPQISYKLEF